MAAVFLALDHAGLLNGAAVEQKFLGYGGFAGVRVRYDRKCAPVFDFFLQVCHRLISSRSCKTYKFLRNVHRIFTIAGYSINVESVRSPHMFLLSTLYPTFYCGNGRTKVRPFLFFRAVRITGRAYAPFHAGRQEHSVEQRPRQAAGYSSRLPSSARSSVTSSTISRWPPTGIP